MLIGKVGDRSFATSDIKIRGPKFFRVDSVIKTAILVTLAGYLEKDEVLIKGEEYYSKKKLGTFFSYVLNDRRAAPRKFDLKFSFQPTSKQNFNNFLLKNDYDCLVSFSGGIDSTAGLMYALDRGLNVLPIWIGFGQKNEEQELKVVKKICKLLKLHPAIIKVDLKKYIEKGWSRWKTGIIPARNYLFASTAAEILSHSAKDGGFVYLCAHKEEITLTNTDKSHKFFKTCSELFSTAYCRKIQVTTPFYKITKPEIISYWYRVWRKKYSISPELTISCYFGNNCGNCKACVNRAVAFSCAGVPIKNFIANPFQDMKSIIDNGYINRFETLKLERKLDFLYAMQMNKDSLLGNFKKFLNVNYRKYKNRITERQRRILSAEVN